MEGKVGSDTKGLDHPVDLQVLCSENERHQTPQKTVFTACVAQKSHSLVSGPLSVLTERCLMFALF